ncbi:hypothetical protein TNCV_4300211, partial [Trichonephila clavipes]
GDGKIRTVTSKTQHGKCCDQYSVSTLLEIRSNVKIFFKGPGGINSHCIRNLSPDEVIFKKYTSSGRCEETKETGFHLIEFVMLETPLRVSRVRDGHVQH